MKKILIGYSSVASFFIPFFVFAEGINTGYLTSSFTSLKSVMTAAVVFLISLAVVWFIWNVVRYAMAEDEGGKEKAKSQMIWGIIAIAVIVSIWGLVGLLRTFIGANDAIPTSTIDKMIPGGSSNQ